MPEPHAPYRGTRLSADERREAVVHAGLREFAEHGLAGASTDRVARSAGVSQPYVFQLFGTKKELFLAVVRHGFERTRLAFEDAADRFDRGERIDCDSALGAMGKAYVRLLDDRTLLLVQLQAYAACGDEEVRTAVRQEFARLHRFVLERSGASSAEIHHFFGEGMLLNVGAALRRDGEALPTAIEALVAGGAA